jgi:hypothetical protein
MTATSLPQAAKAAGISFPDLFIRNPMLLAVP